MMQQLDNAGIAIDELKRDGKEMTVVANYSQIAAMKQGAQVLTVQPRPVLEAAGFFVNVIQVSSTRRLKCTIDILAFFTHDNASSLLVRTSDRTCFLIRHGRTRRVLD
jgi:hypothetical protein